MGLPRRSWGAGAPEDAGDRVSVSGALDIDYLRSGRIFSIAHSLPVVIPKPLSMVGLREVFPQSLRLSGRESVVAQRMHRNAPSVRLTLVQQSKDAERTVGESI